MRRTASSLLALLAALALVVGVAPAASGAPAGATTCKQVAVPVTIAGMTGPIAGTLCTPPGADVVQLLVHGWTYSRYYWDIPYGNGSYSYVQKANQDGYATLAIDRLGNGQSWHPPSILETFQSDANSIHQVIQALRNGGLGTKFGKVIEVGHSFGSYLTMLESGQYHDVDAVMTTGAVHSLNYTNAAFPAGLEMYPATLDAKFANSGLDPLYFTRDPGSTGGYYNLSDADPNVVALDDQLKDTGDMVEMATALADIAAVNADSNVNVPIFDEVGGSDRFMCGLTSATCASSATLTAFERPFYGPGVTVVGYVVPNGGHDLQLERASADADTHMLAFADQYVGSGTGVRGSAPGSAAPVATPPAPQLDLVHSLINQAFLTAVTPLLVNLNQALRMAPGVGTSDDPLGNVGPILAQLGTLDNTFFGNFLNGVLSN